MLAVVFVVCVVQVGCWCRVLALAVRVVETHHAVLRLKLELPPMQGAAQKNLLRAFAIWGLCWRNLLRLPRILHMEVHKVLRLPRNPRFKKQENSNHNGGTI